VFKPVLTDQTKMVLIDGHNPRCSLAFIKAAHDCSIPVLLDLGNPKLGMEELMRMANIIVVPQAYWRTIWPNTHPEKIISEFLRHGPKTVILTMGEDGALVSDGHKPIYQPAHAIRAVDTNGAGDVFMGSFVYGLASGWDLEKTVRFATGAAGFSCTQYGKEKKTPRSVAQIEEFMEKVPLKKTG
jgi:sugar/nucleoside kinase (ribokinase family)